MNREITIIRRWLLFMMVSLILSGITAMPAEAELLLLTRFIPVNTAIGQWIYDVYSAVAVTNKTYPFIGYGYDWLAFGHIVIALFFIGPYQHPIRNKWVIDCGMLACMLVIPFAFIAGAQRGIPVWWRLVDCSFGIAGIIPLIICRNKIKRLEIKLTNPDEFLTAAIA